MIARLAGTLVDKRPGRLVVDVGGVGYDVTVPLGTYSDLGGPGERVELHVHTHVREGSLALFGFRSRLERDLFVRLLDVGGVGPKMAIALLSGLGLEALWGAVRARDSGRLGSVPGIGRKTAERIVVDLADRLDDLGGAEEASQAAGTGGAGASMRQDLISALVNLGYNARVAADAAGRTLRVAPGALPPFDTLLRQTLKLLSR